MSWRIVWQHRDGLVPMLGIEAWRRKYGPDTPGWRRSERGAHPSIGTRESRPTGDGLGRAPSGCVTVVPDLFSRFTGDRQALGHGDYRIERADDGRSGTWMQQ